MTTPKTFLYPEYYIQEDWGLVTQSSTESIDLGLTSSPATEHEDFGLVITTQQELNTYQDQRQFIFDLDNLEERATYSYNDRAILLAQEPDNYGSIADPVDDAIDYGSIADPITETSDYRYIYYGSDVYPFGTIELSGEALSTLITLAIHVGSGSAQISGSTDDSTTFREIGSGSFSAFSGSAEATGANPPDQTLLFEISGTKVERNTYSYNEKSVFIFDGYEDHGVITVVQEYDDYGLLTDQVAYEDNGTITTPFNETTYPYGTAELSGSAITEFVTQFVHVASGSAEFSGIKVEKNTFNEIVSGSAEFSGSKVEKNTFREIGSGTLSAITGAAEATGANPPDSTVLFEVSGTTGDSTTFREIFSGSAEFSGVKVEKNTFSEIGSGLITLSGSAVEKSLPSHYGSGTLSAITGAVEATGANPPDSTVLFSVSGTKVEKNTFNEIVSGTAVFSGVKVEKNTFREIGSGSFSAFSGSAESALVNPPDQTLLFEISGTKVEKNTYSYNERSIFVYGGFEDYGFIFNAIDETIEDYGLLSNSIDDGISDYGTISSPYNETTYPYGTIEVSGSAATELAIQFIHVASGTAVFSGSAPQSFIPATEIGSGTLSAITGSAEVFGANPPDSTVLFSVSGTKVEKNTYSYNERSILPAQSPDNYGLITDAVDESIDYGSIADSELESVSDYRYIYNTSDVYPFGTVEISGAATFEFITQYVHVGSGSAEISGSTEDSTTFREIGFGSAEFSGTKVENSTFREIGSGFFSAITGAVEATGANPPDSTVLFDISGTKLEKNTFREIVSGSAEFSGVKVEKNTFREIGSGSFSAFSGSAESTLVNPPDQTLLFEISGTKVERNTYSYNERAIFIFDGYEDHGVITVVQEYDDYGLLSDSVVYEDNGTLSTPFNETTYPYGTIEVSGSAETELRIKFIHSATGSAEFSGTKVEKNTFREIFSGSVEFSGTKVEKNTFREIGSGSFSAITGAVEATGANPPDSTVLFSVSGATDQSSTFSQVVSGSAEFSGVKVEKNTFREIGSGSAIFSGFAIQNSSPSYYGSGTLSAITGAVEATGANPPDSTVLFEVSGTTDQSSAFREIFSGSAEFSGTKVEKNTFREIGSAGLSSVSGNATNLKKTFSEIGSGSFSAITGAVEATGANPPDSTVLFSVSGTTDQSRTFSEIVSGTATFGGTADDRFRPNYKATGSISAISGSAESTLVNPPDQTLLFEISGSKVERNTYSYNERSIFVYGGSEDYGLVSNAIDETIEDYGLVSNAIDETIDDYGTISSPFNETTYPFGTIQVSGSATVDLGVEFIHVASGTATFGGTADDRFRPNYKATGSISAISGSAESTLVNPPDQTLLFEISGTKVERNTYSYNERSILPAQSPDNYGLITDPVDEAIDYGSIIDSELESVSDYRYIYNTSDVYPFGTVEISGSAVTKPVLLYIHKGSGSAEFSGTKAENNTFREIGSGSALISGNATDFKSTFREIGSGSFSAFGGHAEVFGANPPDSTVLFDVTGTKQEKSTFKEIGSGTAVFSGSAPQSFIPATEIGSGSFSAFSGSAESTLVNPPDQTLLFEISGSKVERNTYSYNDRAVFIFDGYEDHGVITVAQEYDDYGLLTDDVVYEDNGTLSSPFNETVYPFGTIELSGTISNFKASFVHEGTGTAVFSGSAPQSFIPQTEIGSGSAVFSGSATESFNPATAIGSGSFSAFGGHAEVFGANPPDSTVLFDITGSKIEKSTFREIGSGSVTFTGLAPQSFIPATEIGSGSFSAFSGSAESTLVNPPDSTVLFDITGSKIEKSTFREIGSGSATLSGATIAELQALFTSDGIIQISGTKVEKNTFREIGSGSFSAFSGAAEVAGVNPPDQTLLFEFSGTKVEKNTFREIGSGSATFSGTGTARKNPGWFGRGTVEVSGTTVDRSSSREIGSGSAEFSGTALEGFNLGTISGFGSVVISGTMTQNVQVYVPHITGSGSAEFSGEGIGVIEALAIHTGEGSATFSGSAAQSFTPATEIGSGSFSAITGGAESTLVNPPDSTVLFEISGGYTNLKATYAHEGSGSITVSGSSVEKSLPSHYGSGTLSAITGAAEATVSNPPDSTVLFGVSGSATESFTPATEIGSGTFNAFGGHAEVFGANPPENTVLFDISGSKIEKSTFREIGSGSATFSGTSTDRITPVNVSTGSVEFSGSKVEKNTFREIGSGSFSAIVGSVESVGANPPENTVLFEVSGTKVEKNTFREIGSGSVVFSGAMTQNVQVYVPNITGSGIVSITGTAADKFRPNYKATGTITIVGNGKESYSPATEIGGGSIEINGVGVGTYIIARNPYVYVTII